MKNKTSHFFIQNLSCAALCLALCLVLPFLTGQIPEIGNMLCPMHLPVLLAGFICGPWWGGVVGAVAPVYRYLLFGMPPIFPTGLAMCFELATYGMVSGFLYRIFTKNPKGIYSALVCAMVAGRLVWGLIMVMVAISGAAPFTWGMFLSGAFINAVPGMMIQLLLIPVLVVAMQKAGVLRNKHLVNERILVRHEP